MDTTAQLWNKDTRLVHIDLLRMLAILMVYFTHSGQYGCSVPSYSGSAPGWWLYVSIYVFVSCAVPLFFMISGALLLDREESLRQLYGRRVLRFAVVLFVVSLAYYGWQCARNGTPFAVIYYIKQIFNMSAYTQLWFLYLYIGFLVMLPFLRRLARAMSSAEYIYLAVVNIVVIGVLPIALFIWGGGEMSLNSQFCFQPVTVSSVFYVLMGYFLEKRLPDRYYTGRNALISAAGGAASVLVSGAMLRYSARLAEAGVSCVNTDFRTCLMVIPTLSTFFCVKFLCRRHSFRAVSVNLIRFLGAASFGAYLLEIVVEKPLAFIYEALLPHIGPTPASLLWLMAACLLASLITGLLRLIPGVKKFL